MHAQGEGWHPHANQNPNQQPKSKRICLLHLASTYGSWGAGQSAGAVPKSLRTALYPQKKCLRIICSLPYLTSI